MIISKLELYNYRKFKSENGSPGLSITFHHGLNALIGENDAGKSAIVDAIKTVLLTQSNEYIRVTDDDFYTDRNFTASDLRIDITLSDFTDNEAKNFVEYLEFEKKGEPSNIAYFLHLHYHAWKEGSRIYYELKVGKADDGVALDGKARDLLKTVYLKPLRDAEHEMAHGRNSRISQILINHPVFSNPDQNKLVEILRNANRDIEHYFTEEDGQAILMSIRSTLNEINERDIQSNAEIQTSEIKLKSILESLSLSVAEVNPGLGELNLLFIAAELLLLNQDNRGGLKLALVEELEAHLHPQAQLRLIQYLQNEYQNNGAQIIITTHSPILASKINLKNIILIKNGKGYDLAPEYTKLEKGDYLFLQRFLDSTKANMFFAKGVIMVEGDAENILLPMIAEIIDCPLEKNGVSIVNVGSTAFFRYSRIFLRSDGGDMGIPVAIVTDCDVKPEDEKGNFVDKNTDDAVKKKLNDYSQGDVKAFVSSKRTFEYCIALSSLSEEFHRAIHYGKKILNSNKYILTGKKIAKVENEIDNDNQEWSGLPHEQRAYEMFRSILSSDGKGSFLKAIVAQCFAAELRWQITDHPDDMLHEDMFDYDLYQCKIDPEKKEKMKKRIINDPYLKYITEAIHYASNNNDIETVKE